jgi:TRAP-type mannitol/chloroaromatic compound transport system substrate-binding protein
LKMKRRDFLTKSMLAGTATAATALASPAIASGTIEWRMVHSWPKGLPGVGVGAERLARRIETMSGGRMKINVFAAGELVPALGCMDAVMDGTAEMGHDASFYHVGKHPMLAAFFAVPFGMTADEQAAWGPFCETALEYAERLEYEAAEYRGIVAERRASCQHQPSCQPE